jgi:enoyl-CoA hydratase/carnithine racemase
MNQPYEDILLAVNDRVATITLNRPDKLNAWTPAMGHSLRRALAVCAADEGVRAIVITGAGRGFCAGADMGLLQRIQDGRADRATPAAAQPEEPLPAARPGLELAPQYGGRFGYLFSVPKPVIAAINGPCAGLGLVFALYCDLRFASLEARFTTSFAQRGLIAEHGIAWLLPRLVGSARALDLLFSARKFDGAEAERIGLVQRAVPAEALLKETLAYARDLCDTVSPRSMAVMKAQIWKSPFQDFNQALAVADAEMKQSFASEDFREGIAHFLEKRAPRFSGR